MAAQQHGGDWLDKIQAHNRNVYLEEQAKNSAKRAEYEKERARQARLEREETAAHNAEMRKIARQKADAEEARLQIAREERARKEREKQEIGKIHALSRRVKEIDGASDVIKKFMLIIELQKEAAWIDLDSVLDLAYKDRFCETVDIIEAALSSLYEEVGKDAVYLKAYAAAIKKAADTEIHSLADTHKFKRAIEAEKRYPELASTELKKYQHDAEKFLKRATAAKSDFAFFQDKVPPQHHDILKKFIAQKNEIPVAIFSDPEYGSLDSAPLAKEDFSAILDILKQHFLDDAIPAEALQSLCDFFTENGFLDKINLAEQRDLVAMFRICESLSSKSIIMRPQKEIKKADDIIAESKAWVGEKILFCGDRVCWIKKDQCIYSVSWNELAEYWGRDYKGGFSQTFRGQHLWDMSIVKMFEEIIEYKKDPQKLKKILLRNNPPSDHAENRQNKTDEEAATGCMKKGCIGCIIYIVASTIICMLMKACGYM